MRMASGTPSAPESQAPQHRLVLRALTAEDGDTVAHLQTVSWRAAYRGILSNTYLGHDIERERRGFWRKRLASAGGTDRGVLALDDEGRAAGFAFGAACHSRELGHYLDNLHVLPERQGQRIGAALFLALTDALMVDSPECGLYLATYVANQAACAFYERHHGKGLYEEATTPPGGGLAVARVYWWPSTRTLRDILERALTAPRRR